MVIRVGIFNTVNMIGMRIKAPPAPTIPDTIPTIKDHETANTRLNNISSVRICTRSPR
jgi:hypothetical protein